MTLAVIALVVRLGYFLIARDGRLTNADSSGYMLLAQQLAKGAPYRISVSGSSVFPVDLLRPPGYPVFLVVANGASHISIDRVAIVQIIIGASSVAALTYLVGRWAGTRTGVFAGALLALDWTTVLHTPLVSADFLLSIVYGTAIGAFALFFGRKRIWWALLGGVLLGVAALIKPAAEFGVAVVLVAILASPRANWRGLAFLVAFALVAAPWALRNESRHGVFALSTIPSVNTYEFTSEVVLHGRLLWTPAEALSISSAANSQLLRLRLPPAGLKARMDRDSLRIILHHLPKAFVQAAWGALRTGFGTARDTLADSTGDHRIPGLIGTWLPLAQIVGVWLLAAIGAVTAWRRQCVSRSITVLLVAGALLVILPAASPLANARYRVPAAPLMCALAGIGATNALNLVARLRRRAPAASR